MKISKEVKVGFFAIGTIAMFYLGFNYLKGIKFLSRTNTYYVVYRDVGGLTKSNPVTISGFNVGRVSQIRLLQDEGNKVLVALDIDKNIVLGDSAVARLDADFLGDVSIVINVGDISKPLDPLDTLFARVDPGLTELLVESTQPITDDLPRTIANFNDVLQDLEGSGEVLKEALSSFTNTSNKINQLLADNKDGIKESVENFKAVSKKMDQTMDELRLMVSKYGNLADSLKSLELAQTVTKMNTLLDETAATVTAMRSEEGTLGKLMNQDSLYNNLNKTMMDLDSLIININNNPKHFFGPLGKSSKKIQKDRAKQQANK